MAVAVAVVVVVEVVAGFPGIRRPALILCKLQSSQYTDWHEASLAVHQRMLC